MCKLKQIGVERRVYKKSMIRMWISIYFLKFYNLYWIKFYIK